jgi:hypothetical protein
MRKPIAIQSRQFIDQLVRDVPDPTARAVVYDDLIRTLYPGKSDQVARFVEDEIRQGMPSTDAMYMGILFAVANTPQVSSPKGTLAKYADTGMGSLTVGAIIAIIGAVVSTALGVTGIALSAASRNDARDAMAQQRAETREMPMALDEITSIAYAIASQRDIQKEGDAIAAFRRELSIRRMGRNTPEPEERERFISSWREYRNEFLEVKRRQVELMEQAREARREQAAAYARAVEQRTGELITGAAAELERQEALSVWGGLVIPAIAVAGVGALYFLTR